MRTKKRKKGSPKLIPTIIIIIILLLLSFIGYKMITNNNLNNEKESINTIKKHYGENVITTKETDLYNKDGEKIGKINKSVEISLNATDITKETKYFKIKDLEDAYIKYEDVKVNKEVKEKDSRYQKYIPFNQNIKTKSNPTFYDESNNYVYTLNKSYDFKIIIKEDDKYGIEFNNQLLYIKKEDVENVYDNHNTDEFNTKGIPVLNYHAFFDENNETEKNECNTSICHSKAQFKTHLDYFKENNILTIKMNELEMYIDGKLQLPKSVLLTIDDGGRTTHAINMLTEYKMNATIFLVTSWYDSKDYYKTDYIELHSHSHNLHNGGKCPGGQGGEIKCLSRETLLEDLKTSRELLNNTTVFCYPFYEYNEYSISILKEAGFTMSFIGEVPISGGYKQATVGCDKFRIPRFVIMTHTTINDIDNYFNQNKV